MSTLLPPLPPITTPWVQKDGLPTQTFGQYMSALDKLLRESRGFVRLLGNNAQVLVLGYNKITVLGTVVANIDGWWDAATNKYTPKVAGTYLFSEQTLCNAGNLEAVIYLNGARLAEGNYPLPIGNVVTIVNLNGTTDYIEPYVYDPVGGAVLGNSADVNFMGIRLF